jgi:heme O synthase-like polyprenyltransferase
MRSRILVGLVSVSLCGGCANISPAYACHAVGNIIGVAFGTPLGPLGGMLAGMVLERQMDTHTENTERRKLSEALAGPPAQAPGGAALAAAGEPVRVWVDETVQEGRTIPGHFDVRSL